MIIFIESKERALSVLESIKGLRNCYGGLAFHIGDKLDYKDIPLCIKACEHCEDAPVRYVGWNVTGKGFERKSCYCQKCGFALRTLAQADLAVHRGQVIYSVFGN